MYFKRVKKLDCPLWMQNDIVQEIDSGIITDTGMSDKSNLPPIEQVLPRFQDRPEVASYVEKIYGTNDLTGWQLSKTLSDRIYNHYDSFLSMVKDEPKIIIKRLMSEKESFWIHCGKAQLSSLTCVIRTDSLAVTQWYEPNSAVESRYKVTNEKFYNRKGSNLFPGDAEFVTSICLRPWEMIFFDHNSYHSVEKFQPNMERILFSIGFLNTTETELEDIYYQWWTQQATN